MANDIAKKLIEDRLKKQQEKGVQEYSSRTGQKIGTEVYVPDSDTLYRQYAKAREQKVAGGTVNPIITTQRGIQGNQNLMKKPSETYAEAVARNRTRAAELSAGLEGAKATVQEVKDILLGGRNYTHVNPTYSFGNEYDTMTPEEAGAFVSLTKQGKAQQAKEYLEALQMELNRRNTEAAAQRARETAQRNAAAGVALDVAGAMGSGPGALYSLWQEARGKAIDPYHAAYGGVALREGASEGLIGDSTGIEKFLKEAGITTAEWAAQAMSMGPFAPFNMAAGAAGATSRDATMRGGTTEEAAMLGVMSGAAEAVAEKIGFDRWLKFGDMAALKGNKGQLVAQILKDMGSEGLEEGATEIANILADTVIMGDKSQMAEIYSTAKARGMTESQAIGEALKTAAGQIGYSTGLGAVSGGMIGGGMAAMGRVTGQNPLDRMREQYEAATRKPETAENPVVTPQNPVVTPQRDVALKATNTLTETKTPQEGRDPAEKTAQEGLEGYGEKFYGKQGAETYLRKAQESGSFDHTAAFNTYYRAGVAGIREDEIKQTAYTAVADKGMLHEAYIAGAMDSKAEIENAIKGRNKLTGKRGLILGEDVKATDAQMALADFLGKTGGVQIRLVNKLEVTNEKGEVVGSANGKIEDGVITIALDADSFTGTAIHEMVHHIRKVNPAGYDAMRRLVFETANKIGVNMDKVMSDYESTYRTAYGDKTSMMDIMEEVTADGFQKILNDKNAYKEFVTELRKADKGLVAKIKEFLDKLMKTIESLLKDNRYTSFADALGEDLDSVKKLRKMFAEVLVETGKMAGGTEGAAADQKFSIRYTEDGRAVAVVERDILKDLGEKEWKIDEWNKDKKNEAKRLARQALKQFGEVIPVNGIQYRLNKDMRDEYTKSKSTETLYRDKEAFADKMRLADNANDVILATTNWKPEKAENPSKDYIKKFVKGDVLFISGGRKYKARTVVGVDMFGEHYFYDVTWVKKDNFKLKKESPSNASSRAVGIMPGDSSANIVAQKGKDGNKKFSLRDSNGRSLSAGQKEYFKDSKAVDEKGRLLVMYHGTRKGEFESFKDWTYLTANKDYAERYTDKDTGKTMYEVYAKIQKPFDTRIPEVREIFEDEFMGVYGGTPIQESGLPDWTDSYDLAEFIEENDYDFDAILLDEGADYDANGNVVERGISYVIRSSEQAKDVKNQNPTSDRRLKFSMKEDVEETKNLIAVHGIYEENLKKVLDIGGFAMPSIAIIKDSMEHSKYGNISVVFGKETIDPKNKKNAVYGGDAWTPTIPSVNYAVDKKKERAFEKEIYDLGRQILNGMFASGSTLGSMGIDEWTDNSQEQIAHRLADRDAVMAAYAADKGVAVELAYQKKEYDQYGNVFMQKIIDHFGPQKLAEMNTTRLLGHELGEKDVAQIREIWKQDYMETMPRSWKLKKTPEQLAEKAETQAQRTVDTYRAGLFAEHAWQMYEEGGGNTDEIDRLGTQHNLNNAVKHDDVAAWVMPKLDGLLGDAGIYNGKDRYTSSGNRRSFKQLHYPYTLENLVKAMKANQKDRGEGLWGATANGLQSVAAPKYGSIADIKADSGRLQMMGEEEYQEKLKEIDARIDKVIEEVKATNKPHNSNPFWENDIIAEVLIMAVQKGSANAVKATFAKEGYQITDKLANEIYAMARDAGRMPTGYFEAKPQRAVGFDEVRAVVVPSNIGKETRDRLEQKGMNVIEYAAGDEESRLKAVNSVPDVKFSVRDQKYLDAVNSGDMETAEQMVREAAVANGYDSPILYHGTEQFGFTEIDFRHSDDHTSFFMVDSVGTAKSYAGTDRVRPASGKLSEEEKQDAIDDIYNEIFDESSRMYGCSGKYGEDIGYKCHDFATEVAEGGMERAEAIDELYEFCGEIFEKIYAKETEFDEDAMEYEEYEELHADDFFGQLETVADLMLDYVDLMENFENPYGIYKLVANTDNFLEIDAKGRRWNEIGWSDGEKTYNKTRHIAEYANSKGYNGVIFRNIKDFGIYGGDGEPAAVYIAFDGRMVKSADTVAYDENGDVIPLSERFDPNKKDIRWSVREMDEAYRKAVASEQWHKVEDMVEFAARQKGYNSPKLYHGTEKFGFTKIDLEKMDDGISFFMTDHLPTASSYSGTGLVREIGISDDNKGKLDKIHSEMLDACSRIYKLTDKDKERIAEVCDEVISDVLLGGSPSFEVVPEVRDEADWLWEENYDENAEKGEYRKFVSSVREVVGVLEKYLKTWEGSDSPGIYAFYADTSGFFEVDALGREWNDIGYGYEGRWYSSTREIAQLAKELGYPGVIIKDVVDYGHHDVVDLDDPATVYIAFDGSRVKSADPVVYDDEGYMIPLSVRFDREVNEIRYSLRENGRVSVTPSGVEVIQNPTSAEYNQLTEEAYREMPWMRGSGEAMLRKTYDAKGNEYIWRADQAVHADVEPWINRRYRTKTSQHWKWWERADKDDYPVRYSMREYYNKTAVMEESTVDKLLKAYAAPKSPKYAQAYIAYIDPWKFLGLTTSAMGRFRIMNQSSDLDEEKFKETMQYQPIQLWIDHTTGQIEGHEGRHRCVALYHAGVRKIPVLLFDSSNKYDKEHIAEMELLGQDFGRERSNETEIIKDLIPFNYENREEIIKKFATKTEEQELLEHFGMEKTLRYSMKKESVEANIADNDHWKAAYEALLREFEITREPLKDRESARKVVSKFLKEIKSGYSEEDFLNRFIDLCNYGADMQNDSDYKDLVAAMTMLAEDALKESADLDMEVYNKYADLRAELRNGKLRVTAATMKDLEAQDRKYADLRKENFGRVTMSSKDGGAIDTKYAAWAEEYPELFKLDQHTSQAALLLDIIKVRNSLDPVVNNPYFDQLEDYAESYAYELLGRMNDIALEKPTFADKYEGQLRKLREEHKEALRKVKEQAKHEKELLRKKYADNAEARLEAAKQKYEKRMDRKEYWRLRKLAVKDAKALADWLKNPTDKNHVPKKFKEGVEKVLGLIETDRPDLKIALQDFVAMKNGVMELYGDGQGMFLYRERDERVVDILDLFIQKYPNGANLDAMSGTDMKYFRELIASVKKACTDANKLHTSLRERSTVDLSEGFINESQRKKDAKETGIVRRINDFLGLEMLDANSFFKRIGGDVYAELWRGLRKGMDKKVLRWKEAMDFINEVVDPKTVRKWTDEPAKEFEIGGTKVYLSVPQIMSLSCLMRRDQARQHIVGAEIATETGIINIRGGGFKAEVLEKDKAAKKEKPKVVEPTEAEVKAIIGSLTEEQARVAYRIQKFMSENVAAWGNETTMLMFGYERFGTPNYFPIVSDKNFINQLVTKTEDIAPTLRSMGLTKNVNQYANNPVIIQDIFRVFANHVDQMSNYNAFVPSESDFNKFLNFKVKAKGGRVYTVKDEMDRTMGKGGVNYIKNLMNRLVTANGLSDDSDFAKMLVRNMKVASVGANLRVILQQPTAYLRALNYISPKYLLNPAVFKKADLNTVHENAPISLWKEWGNYEMDTGKSMYEQIIAPTKTAWTKDKLLAGAAKMDQVTWMRLWNACMLEAKGKNPKASAAELNRIAGERFSEIVDESQVVDSILHRSQIMRKKGLYTQMTTSFMSEPMKTFNMASNALVELVRNNTPENRKKFARCYATLILSGVATACAAGLADAMRDDDEEEEFLQKWLKAVTGDYSKAEKPKDKLMAALSSNIGDNLNPMGMIPYLRDAWSLIQGYEIKRTDFDWLNDILKNMNRWEKFIAGESEYTLSSMILNTAGAVSKMTGVPVASATRDLKAMVNTVIYHIAGGDPADYTEREYNYQKMSKAISSDKNMTYYTGRMLQAYLNGDKALADRIRWDMTKAGIGGEELDDRLKKGYKAAFREAYRAGDQTAMKRAEGLFREAGADDNAVRDALRSEISAMFDEANEEGDKAEMERLIREYVKYNGKEQTLRKRM